MRPRLWGCLIVVSAGVASAQTVRVSGRVVDVRQAPVQGASVRITGNDTTLTTGPSGTFAFNANLSGRAIVSVAAPGYEPRSISLELARDTVLTVEMRLRVTALNPMVVRPRSVKVRGTIVDSITGEPILFAEVNVYPGGRAVSASNIGRFTFDTVPGGPTILVAQAVEYLPMSVEFDARQDTTITLRLVVDSAAIRLLKLQSVRLRKRSDAEPYAIRSYDRDWIRTENRATVGELIDRMNLPSRPIPMVLDTSEKYAKVRPTGPASRSLKSADDDCFFLDDRKVPPGILDGLYPELIERIETYRNGAMVRVYSKRYVMGLSRLSMLPKMTFIPIGTKPICE